MCVCVCVCVCVCCIAVIQIGKRVDSNTQIHRWKQIHRQLYCSGTNAFINFWLRFFDTRRETILKSLSYHTMLTTPPNARHISWSNFNFSTPWSDPNFSTSLSDPTSHHHGRTPTSTVCHWGRQPNCLPTPSKVISQLTFSKSSNSQDYRFWAWRHSHSSPISYRGFIMIIVIVMYFAHERKLYPMSVHLN